MEYHWLPISFDGNRYEVNLRPDGNHDVIVLCQRRDTGLEFSRTIKPGSRNWHRAVRHVSTTR